MLSAHLNHRALALLLLTLLIAFGHAGQVLAEKSGGRVLMGQAVSYTTTTGKTGDIKIVAVRRTPGRTRTEVVVTSKALDSLDKQPIGKLLGLRLYAAQDPGDEFIEVSGTGLMGSSTRIDSERPTKEETSYFGENVINRRVAKDRYIFVIGPLDQTFRQKAKQKGLPYIHKPFYFMASHRWTDTYGRGPEETYSEISELGPVEIEVRVASLRDVVPMDQTEVIPKGTPDYGHPVGFGMVMRDQVFYFEGAHFIATGGGVTNHGWAWRQVGEQQIGRQVYTVRMPFSPQPLAVTVRGEYEDFNASRSLALVPEKLGENQETVETRIANARKLQDQYLEGHRKSEEELQKHITFLKEEIQKEQKEKEPDTKRIFELKLQLTSYQFSSRQRLEYEIPLLKLRTEAEIAYLQCKWKEAHVNRVQLIAMYQKGAALELEKDKAQAQLEDAWYPQPPKDPSVAEKRQARYKEILAQRPFTVRYRLKTSLDAQGGTLNQMMNTARFSGDLNAAGQVVKEYERLITEYAALPIPAVDKPERAKDLQDEQKMLVSYAHRAHRDALRELADLTAVLGADRAKAASLWAKSYQLYAEEHKERSYTEERYPEWWPESPDGGKTLYKP